MSHFPENIPYGGHQKIYIESKRELISWFDADFFKTDLNPLLWSPPLSPNEKPSKIHTLRADLIYLLPIMYRMLAGGANEDKIAKLMTTLPHPAPKNLIPTLLSYFPRSKN